MTNQASGGSVEADVEAVKDALRQFEHFLDLDNPYLGEDQRIIGRGIKARRDALQALTNLTDRIGTLEHERHFDKKALRLDDKLDDEAQARIAELEAQVDNHRFLSDKYDEHVAELEGKRDSERGLHALTQHAGLIAQEAWEQAQARIHYLEGRVGALEQNQQCPHCPPCQYREHAPLRALAPPMKGPNDDE